MAYSGPPRPAPAPPMTPDRSLGNGQLVRFDADRDQLMKDELIKQIEALEQEALQRVSEEVATSQRRLRLDDAREYAHDEHEKLAAEHASVRRLYESMQHTNSQLGDDIKAFIAKEGDLICECLGEIILTRPLDQKRMHHLNLVASELADIRSRILNQRLAWRPAPKRNGASPMGPRAPMTPGLPYQSPVRRSKSAALVRPRLTPQSWSPMPPGLFLPPPAWGTPKQEEPTTPAPVPEPSPVDNKYEELMQKWRKAEAAAQQAEINAEEATRAAETLAFEGKAALEEVRAKHEQEVAQLMRELAALRDESDRNVNVLKKQFADQAENKEKEMQSFEGELAAKVEERARAERVELLRRQSARRLQNRNLSRGWTAWQEAYEARVWALRKLKESAAHFWKPELARAWYVWLHMWLDIQYEKERKKMENAFENQIEILCRQFAKRLKQQGMAAAWSSWKEFWDARRYCFTLLRHAANHFKAPELAEAWYAWSSFVEAKHDAAAWIAQQRREQGLLEESEQLGTELEQLRADYEKRLKDAEEKMLIALERQRVELVGSTEEKRRLELAIGKEERINQLHSKFSRRLMHQGVALAFSTWSGVCAAKNWMMTQLRIAGNHLRSPELAEGFEIWHEYVVAAHEQAKWMAQQQRENNMLATQGALSKQLESLRAEYERKLKQAEEAKLHALERLRVELSGTEDEKQKLKEEMMKQQRAEEMQKRWARRLMNQGIINAWNAWVETWEARVYAMAQLRKCANHLHSPGLVIGFDAWFEYAEWRTKIKNQKKSLSLVAQSESLQQELERIRAESATKLQIAQDQNKELVAEVKRLKGGVAEAKAKSAEDLEQERLERVKAVQNQITRRIIFRDLGRGWATWHAYWTDRVYRRHQMNIAAHRLRTPELSRAFHYWIYILEEDKRASALTRLKDKSAQQLEAMQSEVREMRFEMGKTDMVLAAKDDELRALREQFKGLSDEMASKRLLIADAETIHARFNQLTEAYTIKQAEAASAKQSLKQAEEDAIRQRKENLELLESLLVEQRKTFQAELESFKRETEQAIQAKDMAHHHQQAQKAEYTTEMNELRSKMERAQVEAGLSSVAVSAAVIEEQRKHRKEMEVLHNHMSELEKTIVELKAMLKEKKDLAKTLEKELNLRLKEVAIAEKKLKDLEERERKLTDRITELTKPPPPTPKKAPVVRRKPKGPLGDFDLDEGPDAPPIAAQIKGALMKNASKVLDLFRSWDDNGDGTVTRKEFHKAMVSLGLEVPAESIDDLFSEWDVDGGGELDFKELSKILRNTKPGADVDSERSKSPKTVQLPSKPIQLEPKVVKTVNVTTPEPPKLRGLAGAAKLLAATKSISAARAAGAPAPAPALTVITSDESGAATAAPDPVSPQSDA